MSTNSLGGLGYQIVNFTHLEYLYEIQRTIQANFPCMPTEFHKENIQDDERLALVKRSRDLILNQELVKKHILANAEFLINLLGNDIDIQSEFYLRVSRPNLEKDFIDWHRDTFYGNSFWELNFWFPVFPLEKGAGLMIIDGSHLEPSNNVHFIQEDNNFRKTVTKGSLANELGYTYASKIDDTIKNCDPSRIKLLTPKFGQGVIFFTHVAHRANNSSTNTRVSLDLRIKKMFAPTNTRAGYFQPLIRSQFSQWVENIVQLSSSNEINNTTMEY